MKTKRIFLLILIIAFLSFPISPVFGTVEDSTNATITITADDAYELYINEVLVGSNDNWRDTEIFRVTLDEEYIIAIKAFDLYKVIAGLSVIIDFDDNRETINTIPESNWVLTTEVQDPSWVTLNYNDEDWKTITKVEDNRWNSKPVLDLNWIWTENFIYGELFDSVVYFRLSFKLPLVVEPTPIEPTPIEPTPIEPTPTPTTTVPIEPTPIEPETIPEEIIVEQTIPEEIIVEQTIPEEAPILDITITEIKEIELPQTSGVLTSIFSIFLFVSGFILILLGLNIKKK